MFNDETPVQLSAKDRELERLKGEHNKMKMKYDEMLQGINKDQVGRRRGGEGRNTKRRDKKRWKGQERTGREGMVKTG